MLAYSVKLSPLSLITFNATSVVRLLSRQREISLILADKCRKIDNSPGIANAGIWKINSGEKIGKLKHIFFTFPIGAILKKFPSQPLHALKFHSSVLLSSTNTNNQHCTHAVEP